MSVDDPISDRAAARDWTLIRFLLWHCAVGAIAGWVLLAGILTFDVGGIGTLVWGAPGGWLALFMMAFFFFITFGSVAMGAAVMTLHRRPPPDGGKRQRIPALQPHPVSPNRS